MSDAAEPTSPRPCVNCGRTAVEHWVRPGVGAMFCEPSASGSDTKYDRGALTPAERKTDELFESALRAVVSALTS